MPLGFALDPLAALFLMLLAVVAIATAIYSYSYLDAPGVPAGRIGGYFFLLGCLVLSMALILLARNGFLLFFAWELMTLSSFALLIFEDAKGETREAGILYLIASQLGAICVMVLFMLLASRVESFDFVAMSSLKGNMTEGFALTIFLLIMGGFGLKAGIVPLHVWLPVAHPVAPAPVSAIMSGVMIKMGIYGMLRLFFMLGLPNLACAWILVGMGIASALLGAFYSLMHHELKKVLAYSSVENVGLIVAALGLAFVGVQTDDPPLVLLGMAGALLHVVNHGLFKSALFLCAGYIKKSCHTTRLTELGGLLKLMPHLGVAFLVATLAISGVPPLNGFVSELFLYMASLYGVVNADPVRIVGFLGALLGFALSGGLVLASFARLFAFLFLGDPRDAHVSHEPLVLGGGMRGSIYGLMFLCVVIGLVPGEALRTLVPIFAGLFDPVLFAAMKTKLPLIYDTLGRVTGFGLALYLFMVLAFWGHRRLLSRCKVTRGPTWDCGYAAPTSRMQYGSSSFVQPMVALFSGLTYRGCPPPVPAEHFPVSRAISYDHAGIDHLLGYVYLPLMRLVDRVMGVIRRFQHGRMQIYIFFILLTLFTILIWQIGIWR